MILQPPNSPCSEEGQWMVSLNMALTLNEICLLRNQGFHLDSQIDILDSVRHIYLKLAEFFAVFDLEKPCAPPPPHLTQSPPPSDWIKINSDAAISESSTTLAVIARDHKGDVLKMCSRKYSPAEADAILWAVQLALSEGWDIIIFGGDSKIFFDLTIIPWLHLRLVQQQYYYKYFMYSRILQQLFFPIG